MDASNRDAKDLLPRGGRFVFNPGVRLPAHVPKAPGLYAIFDRGDGPLMYVGIAKTNLRNRLKQHNQCGRSGSNFVLMLSDMLIFPQLTAEELADIAAGKINAGWCTIDRIRGMAVHYEVMDPVEARRREDIIHRTLRRRLNNPQDGLVRRGKTVAAENSGLVRSEPS